jgi:2-polyprenyl-6-methoxyphenol hydroxylase-like FAD-dependent oxidoreductase
VLGPGQRFFYTLLGDRGSAGASSRGGVYFDASTAGAARPESSPTQLSLLRRWFAGWPDPIGDLLAAVEPDDLLQQAAQVGPLPARLDVPAGTGGVVLLGDAAHLITPELAQGACLAFEDAITLVNLVRDAIPGRTLALALAEYSQLRRARAARVATLSRRLRPLLHARGRLSARARDTALARFAPRLLDRTVAAAVDWSVPR